MNSPAMDDSFARLNYHVESEVGVNEQINHEYSMSYQYHAMARCVWSAPVGNSNQRMHPPISALQPITSSRSATL